MHGFGRLGMNSRNCGIPHFWRTMLSFRIRASTGTTSGLFFFCLDEVWGGKKPAKQTQKHQDMQLFLVASSSNLPAGGQWDQNTGASLFYQALHCNRLSHLKAFYNTSTRPLRPEAVKSQRYVRDTSCLSGASLEQLVTSKSNTWQNCLFESIDSLFSPHMFLRRIHQTAPRARLMSSHLAALTLIQAKTPSMQK